MRKLDLFQVVNSHCVGVAIPREQNLHEVGRDAQLVQFARAVLHMHDGLPVGLASAFSTRNVPRVPNALRHAAKRKPVQAAAHVPAGIAILQPPDKNLVESRTGNDAELSQPGDRSRQPPVRHGDPHAALNDCRENAGQTRLFHDIIIRNVRVR